MPRTLEKITLKQFIKDTNQTKKQYETYNIPKRATKYSAGYDFELLESFTLKPNETKLIPTGIKANMQENEVLMIFIRSSLGFKYNIKLCNQVGIIDKDYYNNKENEGHIFLKIQNQGTKEKSFKKGETIAQGIFINYLTIENESKIKQTRQGGIGSTNDDK